MRRRLAATFALVVGAATVVLAVAVAVSEFPRGLGLLGCVLIAGAAAWHGVLRRGIARVAGLTVAGLALAGAVALLVAGGAPLVDLAVVAGLLVSLAAARATLGVHVDLPSAAAPADRCCSSIRARAGERRSGSHSRPRHAPAASSPLS
jgi:hypothetical protein